MPVNLLRRALHAVVLSVEKSTECMFYSLIYALGALMFLLFTPWNMFWATYYWAKHYELTFSQAFRYQVTMLNIHSRPDMLQPWYSHFLKPLELSDWNIVNEVIGTP